jgi:hypothetical protein
MVYHFLILSDEVEDFVLEIQVHAKNTFLDFHHAIRTALSFDSNYLASFWRTDDNWYKISEATLIDMDEHGHLLMEDLSIEDWCRRKGQKFLYIFDYFTDRSLFIKIVDIIDEEVNPQLFPEVVKIQGKRPLQIRTGEKYIDDLLDAFSTN